MPLYAFNLEIARAGYVTSDPTLGEIRLRWWADAVEGVYVGSVRRHEVCEPLAEAIAASDLPRAPFDALIEARIWDCHREPFADAGALAAYLDATGAGLMWLAARTLGAPPAAEAAVRDLGRGAAAAAFLRAAPALRALGRKPDPLAGLAEAGLAWLAQARAARACVPAAALPALLPAADAAASLRRAVRGASPDLSEFRSRAAMLRASLAGRW